MFGIKHILFPVDFSDRSMQAAPFVTAMARRFGARVTLLNAVQPVALGGGVDPGMPPVLLDPEILRTSVKAHLDGVLNAELDGTPVQRCVEIGDPATAIADFTQTHGVDLVMMPTHGRGPFRSLLLGSITAKVLHDIHCPVWTEAHLEEPEAERHLECRRVLCAVDRNSSSGPLLRWASGFAERTGAELNVVHAMDGADAWPERQFDKEYEDAIREQAREHIAKIEETMGVSAPITVAAGEVQDVIAKEALAQDSDLVIIGRGTKQGTLGRLRTHAHSIIRHSHLPVISV